MTTTKAEHFSFFFWFHDTNYFGIVTGKGAGEIFNILDEYGDPYQCKITPVKNGAAVYYKLIKNEVEDDISEFELSESAQIGCDLQEQSEWIWFKDWFEALGGTVSDIEQRLLDRGLYKPKSSLH